MPLFENTTEVEFAIASRKVKYHDWIRLRNPDFGKETPSLVIKEARSSRPLQVVSVSTRSGHAVLVSSTSTSARSRSATSSGAVTSVLVRQIPSGPWTAQGARFQGGHSFRYLHWYRRHGDARGEEAELAKAYAEVEKVTKQYRNGVITDGERYQKVVDIWTHASTTSRMLSIVSLSTTKGQDRQPALHDG